MSANDQELLRQYAARKSEEAFAALVRRHLNLVYSAALRQVRSPQLAEEVAQSVFVDLARGAGSLKPDTILTAWLYQVTRRTAIDVVRRESRRQAREQIALEMNAMNAPTTPDWMRIEPLLDEAMSALDDPDRAAVLLRYFENKSLREVGAQLGVSDDAAQKRVSRAIERLREFFSKRGVAVGATGLIAVVSANAVQAAPAALAVTISTATIALAATTTLTTQATMHWLNVKSIAAIITSALVAGTTAHVIQQHETNRLRQENQDLLAKQADLTKERDHALSASAPLTDQTDTGHQAQSELLRLRAEVGRLRPQAAEVGRLRAENQKLQQQVRTSSVSSVNRPTALSEQDARDQCINNLRQIDGATQQYALENNLTYTSVVTGEQIAPFFRDKRLPVCPSGGTYTFGPVTNQPSCSMPDHTLQPEGAAANPPTSAPANRETFAAGSLNFQNLTFSQILPFYGELSGFGIVEPDSSINNSSALITIKNANPVTRSEAINLIEVAFLQQAKIATLHLEGNRVVFKTSR